MVTSLWRINMTRCKFKCHEVSKIVDFYNSEKFLYTAKFSPVTSGSEENKKFFAATPSGSLSIGTYSEDLFMPGKEYYLDISDVQ